MPHGGRPGIPEETAGPERRRSVHPLTLAGWAAFGLALLLLSVFAVDEAGARAALEAMGPLAPVGYVLGEVVQVVIAPIPGQPIELAGGWAFGLWAGTLLGSAGALAGSLAAFRIGRRFGRPWVEARISPAVRAKFEAKGGDAGAGRAAWIVFWLMMVPSFPRDPLCYLAGVTGMSTRRFALIALVGRPLGLAPWVAFGAGGVMLGLEVQLLALALPAAVWAGNRVYRLVRPPAELAGPREA